MLIEILRDNPTIGTSERVPGSRELRSGRGFVTFDRADPGLTAASRPSSPTPSIELVGHRPGSSLS